MKVVITGAAGFIGSELAKYLYKKNVDILLIDNLEYGYKENFEDVPVLLEALIVEDVRNPSIAKYFKGADIIFHLAGISSLPECESNPEKAFAVNAASVVNILNILRNVNFKRFIFSSTSAVYENNNNKMMTEDIEVKPNLVYATTKYCAEQICRSFAQNYGMDIFICRFFNVFGLHQDSRRQQPPFTSYLIREINAGKTPVIYNTEDVKRSYIYVDELLVYLEKIMASKKHYNADIFNLCSPFAYSAMDIVKTTFELFGKNTEITKGNPIDFWNKYPELFDKPHSLSKQRIEKEVLKNCIGSCEKIENEFEYSCKIDIKEGLQKIIGGIR